ncbi:uncharacterized protein LOC115452959 [Manduca sexta]|uniref:uncharacterized protein LOC115452959 n=1 Tax=Manduca sexta TaxID=7130 RepID=UPI00188DF247|nr:uncharacterized protein LOC115452959 [Manduca sexta]
MNNAIFFAEGLKFFDITLKEKLDEFDAPPWSPNIEKLSPIKKMNTPFYKAFGNGVSVESFDKSKLEFRSPAEESTPSSPETLKVSLPSTPILRKPISVIMSRIRRINFDLPEDYELQVKSTVDNGEKNGDDAVKETVL